ncbi:MAG: hypothetical protein ACK5WW_10535 [Brevundimonas sp.]|jgi:hypothetical protein|uniref:hypothetical protein n=1 Tax=Brevundimonas sp. TaxID=1871086 RepID=UPI0022C50EC6|nr:hypothetical protein [Brevundimonas sp.]
MSRHNISGSEAFDRAPYILIRGVRPSGRHRRRARHLLASAILFGTLAGLGGTAVALMVAGVI